MIERLALRLLIGWALLLLLAQLVAPWLVIPSVVV